MGSDPRLLTIDELLAESGGEIKTGPFGTKLKAAQYTKTGVPLISVREIYRGRIVVHDDTPCVDESITSQMPEYVLQRGDIVFGRKGAVERNAIVTSEQDGWFLGSDGIRLRLPNNICRRFIAYQLMSRTIQAWLKQHAGGTTMPSLNQKTIGRIPIVLHPLRQQVRIAEILSSLDDKIDLNRRMNGVLESMARAIFKAWFIDFEPVRAKAAGATSFPGMPQSVFDGLPDRLVDSELGEIPAGWEVVPIGKLVEVVGGGTPRTKNAEYWEGGDNPFCTPRDMSNLTSPVLLDTDRRITQAGVDKISSGQLPVGTVILSSRAPIGYLALAATPVSVNQGIIAMLTGDIPNAYVLLWTEANMDEIKSRANGSTFAEISKRSFRPIPAIRPDSQTLHAFSDIVQPLFESITSNLRESQVLANVRDTFLPKLISGELRVPGIEGPTDV